MQVTSWRANRPEGTIRLSDNFLDIIGQVKEQPAPTWQVRLGLAEAGYEGETSSSPAR